MSRRRLLVLGVGWILSLFVTRVLVRAQPGLWTPVTQPQVLSNGDVGFLVEWLHGRVPAGQLVVRINGQWVEAEIGRPPNQQRLPAPPPPPLPPPAPGGRR